MDERESLKDCVVDPPGGWRYGFPKILPLWVTLEIVDGWVVSERYPRKERDSYGANFYK